MPAKKKVDKAAAKAAKQRKIAIVGGILLLALLAIQVPRTMKMLSPPERASAKPRPAATTEAAPAAPDGTTPLLPAPPGSEPQEAAPAEGALPDSDPPPPAAQGQLLAFNRFATKDPFQQQITQDRPGGAAAPPAEPAAEEGGSASPSSPAGPGAVPAAPAPAAPAPTAPATATSASISVNGVIETVAVGGSFPAAEPTFELVALTRTKATLGVAGEGGFVDRKTVDLVRGKPLTLLNTATGVRYVVELRGTS